MIWYIIGLVGLMMLSYLLLSFIVYIKRQEDEKLGLLKRKYIYPDDLVSWNDWLRVADDETLKKFWQYLPPAKTKFESKVVSKLTDKMVSRGLIHEAFKDGKIR